MQAIAQLMAEWVGFFDFLAKATPWALALVGALGYFYREKLKQILAKSLSFDVERLRAELARDHAEYSAKLQRELEAYKVSLIAETERRKAEQDVRKSVALKVAERRLNAITTLMDVHLGIDTSIGAHVVSESSADEVVMAAYAKRHTELREQLRQYAKASDDATLFISRDLRKMVLDFRGDAQKILFGRNQASDPALSASSPVIAKLFNSATLLENALRDLIEGYERMELGGNGKHTE